uniref:NADH dehydrogenase subunit 6 n=1 Tax=Cladiucha magnoliae TaxID=2603932 RepID=UPI002001AD55|nr:NADH dehydrogenase subunit 6 [Cladiucha magnoliae]UNY39797.1 NADH dehydrogenase subunit 6 [Cladiucha magnoliae]
MMKFLLLYITLMNSFLLMLMKNPFSFGLTLLIQTLLISLSSSMMSPSSWYSYMLFLTMIGGMLILFIYMSSLSSNQKFYFNKFIFIYYLMFLLIFMWLMMNMYIYLNFQNENLYLNYEIKNNFFMKMSLNKLYNYPTNQIMLILINYLLLTMFIVVKITNIKMGSLRKKN